MTAARDFNKKPRRVCCELREILALPARRAGTNRHIILQQYRPGLRATKRASSRLDAESVREGRKKISLSPFIPMHDHAYGRTGELLTTGGCIADVSDGNVSQVTAHTHTHTCGQSPRPNRSETIRPAGYQSILPLGRGSWPFVKGRRSGVAPLQQTGRRGECAQKVREGGGGRGKGAVALQAKRKDEVDTDALKGDYERGGVRPVSICR